MKPEPNRPIDEAVLLAYINHELSPAERQQVDHWLAASTANKQYFDELEQTWILTGKIKIRPVFVDPNQAWEKVKGKINATSLQPAKKQKVISMRGWISIAASVLILIGCFSVYQYLNRTPEQVVLTAQNDVVKDTLSDGSVIALNKGSVLEYPENFVGNERRVKLKGEGFFEIRPDQSKPFIIELSHQAQVTVLGTSFTISEKETSTEVVVKTGKVEFKGNHEAPILTPGEKGILDIETGSIRKAQASEIKFNEAYWLDQKLDFINMDLDTVLTILSDIFETEITLENEAAGTCILNTQFERESLEHMLEVIGTTFELDVQKTEKGYRLNGNGC